MSPLILVVDNNLSELELIQEGLRYAGVEAEFASAINGVEALARLRRAAEPRPAAILLDLQLWGMHGRDVLAAIKGDPALRAIHTIILTGMECDRERAACLALGADGFVIKPSSLYDYGALADRLRAGLLGRAAATSGG